jgi:hypothetical protein
MGDGDGGAIPPREPKHVRSESVIGFLSDSNLLYMFITVGVV